MIKDNQREQMKTNLEYWDEVVDIHAASPFYRMEDFKSGKVVLNDLELGEVGDVGQVTAAPAVPLRHGHAFVGAAGGERYRHGLLRKRHQTGESAGKGCWNRRALYPLQPVRPAEAPGGAVRYRLHFLRRAHLAAGYC